MIAAPVLRFGAAALTATLSAGLMLLGASAASAQPRVIECTIDLSRPLAPVSVRAGEQVQLRLTTVVPVLGTRISVDVGPPQTIAPGTETVTGTVQGATSLLGGLVGRVCQAVVQVQTAVTSAVPVPPIVLPTVPLPPVLPSQTVQLPGTGIGVGIEQPGAESQPPPPGGTDPTPPGGTQPGTQPPGSPGMPPGYRYERGGLSVYDFTRLPYGVASRFGPGAAPAFRFGQQLPGYSPQFGVLDESVADAGDARALPVGGPGAVALPVLLAVLMLSAVAGALVRTWALRRAV